MDDGMGSTFSQVSGWKLSICWKAAIHRDLDMWKKGTGRDIVKFQQRHLGSSASVVE